MRFRLMKQAIYRRWKTAILKKGKKYIESLECDRAVFQSSMPYIILCTFHDLRDFLILSSLFNDKDLSYVAPTNLPNDPTVKALKTINHIIYINKKKNFSVLKNILKSLRDFNRTLVLSLGAARAYADEIALDPVTIIRIAMKANVPILPVTIAWPSKEMGENLDKCSVKIGNPIYISPRTAEFKDIFFKFRGVRKFQKLPRVELQEIATRILSRLDS